MFNDLDLYNKKYQKKIFKSIFKTVKENNFIFGKKVEKLEKQLSKFTGSKYVCSVGSGTDALLISLLSLNLKKGDEIIIPSFSWLSVVEVVLFLNLKPIFIETNINDYNLDFNHVKKLISKKTKAVISTSLFGRTCKLDKLKKILPKKICLIEDGAQNFGSIYKNKNSLNIADISCTSFFPSKNLGSFGDGGAIFTNDKEIYEIGYSAHIHGMGKNRYDYERIGMNARMSTIQAAILLEKLEIFPKELTQRQKVADNYNKILNTKNLDLKLPSIHKNAQSSWAQYTIILPERINRDELQEYLKLKNIPTAVYYPSPINMHQPYSTYPVSKIGLDITNYLSKNVLSLPMHPYLNEDEIVYIAENMYNYFKNH